MTPKLIALAITLFCFGAAHADEAEVVTEVAVKTATITDTTLHAYIQAYGLVEPALASHGKAAASARVASPVAGIIAQVYCEEGGQVQKNAPLFALDKRATAAQIAKAEVAVEFAKKNLARKRLLKPDETISRKLLDDAEQLVAAAQTDLQTAQTQGALQTITAPLAGTVSAIHFKVGEAVSASSVLADLIDAHRLELVLHVPSQEAAALQVGQSVAIDVGKAVLGAGKLSFINPQIDPLTDTVLVRVELPDSACSPGQCLRSGQFVHAQITVETRPHRLAVPFASVVNHDGHSVLAVVEGDQAVQRPVVTGLRDGDWLEVSGAGLGAGMIVVSEGAYGLPPQTRVRVLP